MTPYRTAAGYGEAEYEDKRSRFIGHIKPVTSENEAKAFIDEMRRTYADATHNVFAYVLREGNILRWSDDGEPGGTSGQPTLAVLQGAGLTDVCCVTTRYFGGTLLGPGGLVRAYTAAAQAAVEAARAAGDIVEMTSVVNVDVPVAYPLYEQVVRMIADTGGKIAGTDYTDQVLIHAIYREGEHEALRPLLTELMAGKEVVEVGRAHFDEF